jgi:hypothetical protein
MTCSRTSSPSSPTQARSSWSSGRSAIQSRIRSRACGLFGDIDLSEAEICAAIRDHDDTYVDEDDELKSWVQDRGVEFSDREFGLALGHLATLGRLRPARINGSSSQHDQPG